MGIGSPCRLAACCWEDSSNCSMVAGLRLPSVTLEKAFPRNLESGFGRQFLRKVALDDTYTFCHVRFWAWDPGVSFAV